MTRDLYVKNISSAATEEDVRKLFSVAGKVAYIHLVTDAATGEGKGCGYVKMASEAEAKEAIACLDGALLINRIISVTEARPQKLAGGPKPARQERAFRPQRTAEPRKRERRSAPDRAGRRRK